MTYPDQFTPWQPAEILLGILEAGAFSWEHFGKMVTYDQPVRKAQAIHASMVADSFIAEMIAQ